jgi:hypothetical protein
MEPIQQYDFPRQVRDILEKRLGEQKYNPEALSAAGARH